MAEAPALARRDKLSGTITHMVRTVPAVYEHGILRLLEPVSLAESEHVLLTIHSGAEPRFEETEPAHAAAPSIEEVRQILSVIPGSMAEAVSQERGEY